MLRRTGYRRDGFTLIEVLVVIGIILVLMGLLIPATMKVRESSNRATNADRMQQITNAVNTYKTSGTLGKPDYLPRAPFQVRASYLTGGVPDPLYAKETAYLAQVFPRINFGNTGATANVTLADNNQVVVFFLTGGSVTSFEGFSTNSQQPFALKGSNDENRNGRFIQKAQSLCGATSPPQFLDVYGTPYAVFLPTKQGNYATQTHVHNSITVNPFYRGSATPLKYENPTTLQIISAGPDGTFGVGGDWSTPVNANGKDDLSNFSRSVLGSGPQ